MRRLGKRNEMSARLSCKGRPPCPISNYCDVINAVSVASYVWLYKYTAESSSKIAALWSKCAPEAKVRCFEMV